MDWFEKLTGFPETDYHSTRAKLKVADTQLHSLINGKSYGIGDLSLEPLEALQVKAKSTRSSGKLKGTSKNSDLR
jgi:hypothetical protein